MCARGVTNRQRAIDKEQPCKGVAGRQIENYNIFPSGRSCLLNEDFIVMIDDGDFISLNPSHFPPPPLALLGGGREGGGGLSLLASSSRVRVTPHLNCGCAHPHPEKKELIECGVYAVK